MTVPYLRLVPPVEEHEEALREMPPAPPRIPHKVRIVLWCVALAFLAVLAEVVLLVAIFHGWVMR